MASVAIRYAKALADIAVAKNLADTVLAEMRHFSELLAESHELTGVLANPAVSVGDQKKLIRAISQRTGFSAIMQNFLSVLADHRRFAVYGEIWAAVQRELDDRLGIESVEVSTAVPLSIEQKTVLIDRLRRFTKKEVRVQYHTDPQLIGGLMAKIGSTIYDGSIRGQLQQVRQQLSRG